MLVPQLGKSLAMIENMKLVTSCLVATPQTWELDDECITFTMHYEGKETIGFFHSKYGVNRILKTALDKWGLQTIKNAPITISTVDERKLDACGMIEVI